MRAHSSVFCILLLLFISSAFAQASYEASKPTDSANGGGAADCNVRTADCSFYTRCVNRTIQCASTDYATAFGLSFCNQVQNATTVVNDTRLQNDLRQVQMCLQTALVSAVHGKPTCKNLRNSAFDSHPRCLNAIANKFCSEAPRSIDRSTVISLLWNATAGVANANSNVVLNGLWTQISACAATKFKKLIMQNATFSDVETLKELITEFISAGLLNSTNFEVVILDSNQTHSRTKTRSANADTNTFAVTFTVTAPASAGLNLDGAMTQFDQSFQNAYPNSILQTCDSNTATQCASSQPIAITGDDGNTSATNTVIGSLFMVVLSVLVVLL